MPSVNTNQLSILSFLQCPYCRWLFHTFSCELLEPLLQGWNFSFLSCTLALFLPIVRQWCSIFTLQFSHHGFFLAFIWFDSLCVSHLVGDQGGCFIHIHREVPDGVVGWAEHEAFFMMLSFFGLNAPMTDLGTHPPCALVNQHPSPCFLQIVRPLSNLCHGRDYNTPRKTFFHFPLLKHISGAFLCLKKCEVNRWKKLACLVLSRLLRKNSIISTITLLYLYQMTFLSFLLLLREVRAIGAINLSFCSVFNPHSLIRAPFMQLMHILSNGCGWQTLVPALSHSRAKSRRKE